MAFGALSLKGRALRHLSRREHSRAELERKLAPFAQELVAAQANEQAERPAEEGFEGRAEVQFEGPGDARAVAAEQVAAALDDLTAKGLLSDQRTAESMITGQARRLGVHRLKQNMKAKGLDRELIDAALEQAHAQGLASELERARGLWQRRFGEPAADPAGRAKQMRFLAGRGFGGDVIHRVLQDARDRDQEQDQHEAQDQAP
jgi:regulatory protein